MKSKEKKQIKAIDILSNFNGMDTSQIFVDFWFLSFKKNKWITTIATLTFFIVLISTIYYIDLKEKKQIELSKKENINLNNRIKDLETIEKSLHDLSLFIENQKQAILKTEQNILELKKKQVELEPIVLSQQKTVEAIFSQQEKRNFGNRWIERIIGFGLGIAASIIASILFGITKRYILKKKN